MAKSEKKEWVSHQSVWFCSPFQWEQRRFGHNGGFRLHNGVEGPNFHYAIHVQTCHFSTWTVHPVQKTINSVLICVSLMIKKEKGMWTGLLYYYNRHYCCCLLWPRSSHHSPLRPRRHCHAHLWPRHHCPFHTSGPPISRVYKPQYSSYSVPDVSGFQRGTNQASQVQALASPTTQARSYPASHPLPHGASAEHLINIRSRFHSNAPRNVTFKS